MIHLPLNSLTQGEALSLLLEALESKRTRIITAQNIIRQQVNEPLRKYDEAQWKQGAGKVKLRKGENVFRILPEKQKRKRKMSSAARKRISAAQRKRWAAYHKAQKAG